MRWCNHSATTKHHGVYEPTLLTQQVVEPPWDFPNLSYIECSTWSVYAALRPHPDGGGWWVVRSPQWLHYEGPKVPLAGMVVHLGSVDDLVTLGILPGRLDDHDSIAGFWVMRKWFQSRQRRNDLRRMAMFMTPLRVAWISVVVGRRR